MRVDINKILTELSSLPDFKEQLSLQGVFGQQNYEYGTGKLEGLEHKEEDFTEFLFDLPYTNSILEKEGMFRTRVMKLKPKSCYTYHKDPTKRKHIPLVTNYNCFFVVQDEVVRMPANGSVFILDTTKMHTALNASRKERIHIVGCFKE